MKKCPECGAEMKFYETNLKGLAHWYCESCTYQLIEDEDED
ncbi:MAG: zf-TFIIB domain-containing protein [Candidatus Bathyarchaeia archaeon]